MTQPPTSAEGGTAMQPVRVAIQDSLGNTLNRASAPVTLALAANPTGAKLQGTTTVETVNGIATFADLRVDNLGSGYTFAVTSPGRAASRASVSGLSAAVGSRRAAPDTVGASCPPPAPTSTDLRRKRSEVDAPSRRSAQGAGRVTTRAACPPAMRPTAGAPTSGASSGTARYRVLGSRSPWQSRVATLSRRSAPGGVTRAG